MPPQVGMSDLLGGRFRSEEAMARITITVEDRDDGAVLIASDAEMSDLTAKAVGDGELTSAEYLAVSAWHVLHSAAKEVAAENGAQVASWDDQRTVN